MTKNKIVRRKFILDLAGNLLFLMLSKMFFIKRLGAKTKPRIIILGMGIGGATCLSYLSKLSNFIEIIVIEKSTKVRTGPFTNLVIGDILEEDYITFKINEEKYRNVKFIYNNINFIDSDKQKIVFSDGVKLDFDFLVLSPGIGYKENIIKGFSIHDKKNVPHCWDGGSDILSFKKRLHELEDGSQIIISAPDYPYRCPPAPYERASLIANYKIKIKKNIKILILDSKDSFTKQDNFFREWKSNYKDIIEWVPRSKGGRIIFYDQKNNLVKNDQGQVFKADFIHIIPDQKAAKVITDSNLISKEQDWCQINPISFELEGHKNIYVIGDSINAWAMPKSAFSANSQAKVLSINLINKILEKDPIDPVFLNTCYSFSKEDRAFSISSWYRLNLANDRIISLGSSQSNTNSNNLDRRLEASHAFGWYETMVKDLFL